MKPTLLLLLLSFAITNQVLACDIDGFTGIVEDNDLYIPIGDKSHDNGITEEDFNQIIDEIEAIYGPVIEARGKTLNVERKWEDGTVNAYAQQIGDTWKVSMFGGLARHEAITKDAFAYVVCHELGHHLGGAPKKSSWFGGKTWASNEGQSDYFAGLKCMRKYMENHDNAEIVAAMKIDAHAETECSKSFANENQKNICLRIAMGGLSLGNLFKALRRLTTTLEFTTPDTNVVSKTSHNHPAPQCRLDTYFQAGLCVVDHTVDVDDDDYKVGTCSRDDSYESGIRPLCWFKP